MIKSFVLIVVLSGGYNTTSPSIAMQEFSSKETCIAAAVVVQKNLQSFNRPLHGIEQVGRPTCVPK